MNRIFIGFDSAQAVASQVLEYSIRRHAKRPVEIVHVRLDEMRAKGFSRPHDPLQSTEFTYTRFLVPWLCGYEGTALFIDGDMLALGDLTELFDLDMGPYALRVVKHDHRPAEGVKMGKLGMTQTSYPRKNWSSLMLMRCDRLKCWTKEAIETRSGAWLHRFEPIPDALIGDVDGSAWNVLDRYDERTKLVHYTSGGPWTGYGDVWYQYKADMEKERARPPARERLVAWTTGHVFNEAVMSAVIDGLRACGADVEARHASLYKGPARPCVSYGVLRGVDRVYRECAKAGVEWWNVDHGFFRPSKHKEGRFDGHYRIGRNHLMPLFRPGADVDGSRWERLGVAVKPWRRGTDGAVLLCPPTPAMGEFYRVDPDVWAARTRARLPRALRDRAVVRKKTDPTPLAEALARARLVVVFNSNVAVEALVEGVRAVADEGIVRAWNGLTPETADADPEANDREELFRYAAWCQFTLEEIRSGAAWEACVRVQRGGP